MSDDSHKFLWALAHPTAWAEYTPIYWHIRLLVLMNERRQGEVNSSLILHKTLSNVMVLTMPQIIRAMETTGVINLAGSIATPAAAVPQLNYALCTLIRDFSRMYRALPSVVGIAKNENFLRLLYNTPWANTFGLRGATLVRLFIGLLKMHKVKGMERDTICELNLLITEFLSIICKDQDAALEEHLLGPLEQARQADEATMDELQQAMEMTGLTDEPPEDDDRDVVME